jgi:sporulation protein YlmC with PRC-barrel domain
MSTTTPSDNGTPAIGEPVATTETDRLIASDRVEGTRVYNPKGEHLGSVLNFMVDKVTGQVGYVVVSFGGFLGFGERYYPLPWKVLTYDVEQGGFIVDLDKSAVEKAPSYTKDESPWDNPQYARDIYGYYGVPWYY